MMPGWNWETQEREARQGSPRVLDVITRFVVLLLAARSAAHIEDLLDLAPAGVRPVAASAVAVVVLAAAPALAVLAAASTMTMIVLAAASAVAVIVLAAAVAVIAAVVVVAMARRSQNVEAAKIDAGFETVEGGFGSSPKWVSEHELISPGG